MNPLKNLVNKLDKPSYVALESAVNYCMQWTHYNVEIEHWLMQLLQQKDQPLNKLLDELGCSGQVIINDINRSLEKLKKGNEQMPAISPRIIEWINQAWLMASLEFQGQAINPGLLLCTLLENQVLGQLASAISPQLATISVIRLRSLLSNVEVTIDKLKSSSITQQTALSQYTINLNELAGLGKLDEVIGREDEICQLIDILSRRRQNNVILTGEPGVGKTAIVEGLALKIHQNDVPDSLHNVIIRTLDMGLLQAGASVKGEFEQRLKNIIDEIKQAEQPILLFIDEAHMLIGAGGAAGQGDAANLLKPALARGELRTIAATTWGEYKQYFEKDAALTRRFQVVKVEEPRPKIAIEMLRALTSKLEKHHGVMVLDEAIIAAVNLSDRYLTGRQLPDKSMSVLDTACSRVASKLKAIPNELDKVQRKIKLLLEQEKRLEREQQQGILHTVSSPLQQEIEKLQKAQLALEQQWQAELAIVNKIMQLRESTEKPDKVGFKKQYKELANLQKGQPLLKVFVDKQVVAQIIADWTGVPVGNMMQETAEKMHSLSSKLQQKIIGQDHAINKITQLVKTASVKLADPSKPMGVFLLVGPSGVGKTETAQVLAQELFGSKDKMTVINMSEFKEEHKISMLTGAPPGYVGYAEGGVLTEAVRRKPYSLILLDEMEKAHRGVQDVFYQVFDKGMLKDGQGREVNFKNTLIMMTSNACSEYLSEYGSTPLDQKDIDILPELMREELLKYFKPAFLGRVNIVPYLSLKEVDLRHIVKIKLEKIKQRVQQQQNADLIFSEDYIINIMQKCQQSMIGARQVDHLLSTTLLPQLADLFIDKLLNKKQMKKIHVNFSEGELCLA